MLRRALVACTVAAAALVPAIAVPRPAAAAPLGCAARNPFDAGYASRLASRYPGQHFSARVYDQATGCTYDLNPGRVMTTASVVTLEIMTGVLLRAQREGRGLTATERSRIHPMITESANTPASQLFSSLGGVGGMDAISRQLGMGSTKSTSTWGLTTTTTADQVTLVRHVLGGEPGPLTAAYRAEARAYAGAVVPSQRWGTSAALPGGFRSFQKNGFAGSQCCGWRLNSVGYVERPGGTGWALAILTDGWPTQASGTPVVDAIGADINRAMLASPTGTLEAVGAAKGAPGTLVVSGWSADPSDTAPLDVHVYVDGAFAGHGTADGDRPDVAAALPGQGAAHGFRIAVPASVGAHQVCAIAVNVGPVAPHTSLGCGTATVRADRRPTTWERPAAPA